MIVICGSSYYSSIISPYAPLSVRTEEGLELWDREPSLFTFIQILQNFDNLKGESLNFLLAPPARQTLSYQSGNWFILKVRSN